MRTTFRLVTTLGRCDGTFGHYEVYQTKMWQILSRSHKQQYLDYLRLFYTSRYASHRNGKKDENLSSSIQKEKSSKLESTGKDRAEKVMPSTPDLSAFKTSDKSEPCDIHAIARRSLIGNFKSYQDIIFLIGILLPRNVVSYFDGFTDKMGIEVLFEVIIAGLSTKSIEHLIELNRLPFDCFKGLVDEANTQWLEHPRPCPVYEPHMLDMFVDEFDNTVKKVYVSIKSNQEKTRLSDTGNRKPTKVNPEKSIESKSKDSGNPKSGSIKSTSPGEIWPQIEKDVVKAIDGNISTKIQRLMEVTGSVEGLSSQIDVIKKELHKVSSAVGSFKTEFVKNRQLESATNTLTANLRQNSVNFLQNSKEYTDKVAHDVKDLFSDETLTYKKDILMIVQRNARSMEKGNKDEMKQLEYKHARDIKILETRILNSKQAYQSLETDLKSLQAKLKSLLSVNEIKTELKALADKPDQYVTKKEFEAAIKPLIQATSGQKTAKTLSFGEFVIIDSLQNKTFTSTMPVELCKQDVVKVLESLSNVKQFNGTIKKLTKKGFEIVGGTEDLVVMRRSLKASRRQHRLATLKWLLLIVGMAAAGVFYNGSYIGTVKADDHDEKNKSTLERLIGPVYTYPR